LKIIAAIEDPPVIIKILSHLGLLTRPKEPFAWVRPPALSKLTEATLGF
jgi:hypothetical protein